MHVHETESMLDYDLCIFYGLVVRIVQQTDATTIAQPKQPGLCDSAMNLLAAPTLTAHHVLRHILAGSNCRESQMVSPTFRYSYFD